jgi:hypothetical protein
LGAPAGTGDAGGAPPDGGADGGNAARGGEADAAGEDEDTPGGGDDGAPVKRLRGGIIERYVEDVLWDVARGKGGLE